MTEIVEVNGVRIAISHRPLSPAPGLDWWAVDDRTYDGEGCPVGRGATRELAIAVLLEQIEADAEPGWPRNPDGSNKTIREMTAEEAAAVKQASRDRLYAKRESSNG